VNLEMIGVQRTNANRLGRVMDRHSFDLSDDAREASLELPARQL
jgi:hypothetical protein